MTLKEDLQKAFRKGVREGLRPHVAHGLELMYGHLDLGSRTWEDEANTLLDHMRNHAKSKRSK